MKNYVVYNEKLKESVTIPATSVGNAMHKARKQEGWTHYGSRKHDGSFRYYQISIDSEED